MKLTRVWEAPRVTKPYSEEQWAEVQKLGHEIDASLGALDVRLTMGGEPTFVSIDDHDGAEWNTAALGPDKRRLSIELYKRLKDEYAATGLAHFGQGKWYPGEPLPRWSLNCFWRRDGEPIWQNPELLADETASSGASHDTAQRFLRAVATRLGLSPTFVFAAYEDAFYYMWREQRLPSNVDPFESQLENPGERTRLVRIFERGLDRPAGYVFPVSRDPAGVRWQTGPWFLRQERCYLVPGDSPIGYRLPLDSLPWAVPGDITQVNPPDPTQTFPPLAPHAEIRQQLRESDAPAALATAPAFAGGRTGAIAAADGLTAAQLAASDQPQPARMPPRDAAPWIQLAHHSCVSQPAGSPARQCVPRHATACCTSSCRPRPASKTTWSWWPPLKPPPRVCRNRSSWKVTSHRAIHGSTASV
jgi:uncharacterized protein (DUF2126 family)